MKCPVCSDVRMREVEKEGILIDVCPDCKGVWLDRGELEKLMNGVREFRDEYNTYVQNYPPNYQQPNGGYVQPNTSYNAGNAPVPPNQYNNQQQSKYDSHKYGQQNYGQHSYGHSKHYGHKHKKPKTVFDVLGDLFD
ncbi:zf-TFIIB domain-containing protein [Paenibacillus sp. SC116]|uniref:TFIIB-type zinc ribbon-containing protein n=1 Tax=Paenibacillus sp. SC116 TaxID=2968986 RepID=UPI00215A1745|nr:zf-TFIIB domain-containing protein [Paenibacillus sp. SC116]MCR8843354.1 zf-TFIIB domain-containing protein [Paenibacillus sp. SC116]